MMRAAFNSRGSMKVMRPCMSGVNFTENMQGRLSFQTQIKTARRLYQDAVSRFYAFS